MKNLNYNGVKIQYDSFNSTNLGFCNEVELISNGQVKAKVLLTDEQLNKL